jgi:hypothetical protein
LTSADIRSPYDPGEVLSKLGKRSVDFWAQLITSLDQDNAVTTIEIDRDHAAVTVPSIVHIGSEAFYVIGKAGTGGVGDPWRFTLATRGVAETQIQQHAVNIVTGQQPLVYWSANNLGCANWRSRRARLEMAQVKSDGTLSDFVEIIRGFVDATPRVDGDGLRITLELLPFTTLLDNKLATKTTITETQLVQGWHYFEYPFASTLEHGQWWEQIGSVFDMDINNVAIGGAVNIPVPVGGTVFHQGAYDVTLPQDHPRKGVIYITMYGDIYECQGYALGVPPGSDSFVIAAPGLRAPGVTPFNSVSNKNDIELISVDVASGPLGTRTLLRWPDAAIDAVQTSWNPGTFLGIAGAWANVTIDSTAEEGPQLVCSYNIEGKHFGTELQICLWSNRDEIERLTNRSCERIENWRRGYPAVARDHTRQLWYPIDFQDPDEDLYWPQHQVLEGGRYHFSDVFPNEESRLMSDWGRKIRLGAAVVQGAAEEFAVKVPIRGIASAFYQTGERFILVEDELTMPSSGTLKLLVTYWTPFGVKEFPLNIISVTQVFDGGNPVGWALELSERDRVRIPSFGDWPGVDRTTFKASVEFEAEKPNDILLQLLLSGGGNQINSATYDVLPVGANLKEEDVDVESFLRFTAPAGMGAWTLSFPSGETIKDILEDMLTALGAAIVSRIDPETGVNRLTLIPIGPENPMESVVAIVEPVLEDNIDRAITDGDWLVNPIPSWGSDDRIVNKYIYKTNWTKEVDPEAELTIEVYDKASIAEVGEAEELSLDLRGVLVDRSNPAEGELVTQGLTHRLITQFGTPRRTWSGSVNSGLGVYSYLGAVYIVGSRFLRGYGSVGLDGIGETGTRSTFTAGRVIEEVRNYWEEGTSLVLVHYGLNGTGWNASARVSAIFNATTLTFEANDFTTTEHPLTGEAWKDVDGFFVGQNVVLFPEADRDTSVALVVASIDRTNNRITFTGAHGGPAVGSILTPASYDQTVIRLFAHLADANERLGAANDPAQEIT